MTAKKTSTGKSSVGTVSGNHPKVGNWESNHARIFEPTRREVTYKLDTMVTDTLSRYEQYLMEVFNREPNMSGVLEAMIIDALSNHADFQKYLTNPSNNQKKNAPKTELELNDDETQALDSLDKMAEGASQKSANGVGAN